MDSEKFDKVVLDLLYDELDELTRASAIRHLEQSGHAKALYSELKATRAVGGLPLVEPPPELEERILAAEAAARKERSLGQRFGGFVSIAASYAMRPQMAMAALLMLMVGSSLLFLRVKPGETSSVQVTERGVPESDKEVTAVVPVPEPAGVLREEAAPASRAAQHGRSDRDDSPADKDRGRAAAPEPEATRKTESAFTSANEGVEKRAAPSRAFAPPPSDEEAANDVSLDSLGGGVASGAGPAGGSAGGGSCANLSHYEDVARSDPSPVVANAARWAAADCYVALGRIDRARAAYTALMAAPDYAARARQALAALPPAPVAEAEASAAPAAPPPAKAKAATAPAGPPAATTPAPTN